MILAPAAVAAMAWWWGASPTSFPAPTLGDQRSGCSASARRRPLPLLLFALAARKLSLTTLGLIQYLSPTIQFLLGIWLFHEPFSANPAGRLRADLDRARALHARRLAPARARPSPRRRRAREALAGGDRLRRAR